MSYNSKYTGEEVEAALALARTAIQQHQDISGKLDVSVAEITYANKAETYTPIFISAPTSSTLTFTYNNKTYYFNVGQEVIVGEEIYKLMSVIDGVATWKNVTPVIFAGHFDTEQTPYLANTIILMSTGVYISNEQTTNAPVSLFTDKDGNRFVFSNGGYVISNEATQSSWNKIYDL